MKLEQLLRRCLLSALMLLAPAYDGVADAAIRIAVLDFELNDITSLPNTPGERIRTASIKPLLEQALVRHGDYRIIEINPSARQAANSGFGYLFRFDEEAAKLGKQAGADWVIVGRHSKPSFLFSYLMAHLIDVESQKRVAGFDVELKGNHEKVTLHGAKNLAGKIDNVISRMQPELAP